MVAIGGLCKRCKKEETVVVSRKDAFCESCFVRFIRGKQRKQMQNDLFKVKFNNDIQRPKILFDMENNLQSFVLFDILVSMLVEQLMQGPKAVRGFDLLVCIIDDKFSDFKIDGNELTEYYTREELERLGIQFVKCDSDDYVTKNTLEHLRLDLKHFQTLLINEESTLNNITTYKELLSQIKDNSTRNDMIDIIHKDLIIQAAKDNDCSIILESHSMTNLAVQILSDTIRGRGSEIPLKFTDKYVGNFEILHPLQDILNSEVKQYLNILDLNKLISMDETIVNKSLKYKTVNMMVQEYFESLETEYSEVVSTVVKIGTKLGNPIHKTDSTEHCEICKVPIYHDPKEWLEQITVDGYVEPQNEEERENLQRYINSLDVESIQNGDSRNVNEQVKLCYGCMVTMGVSEVKDFEWPKRPTRDEILSEYILTDDEE